MNIRSICILGGTGFVGRHLIPKLSAKGIECRVLTRHASRHRHLDVNPGCRVIEADIFDKADLEKNFTGCDGVINLVGILNEDRKNSFRKMHVELVDIITAACRASGIKRLLHMSALNANAGSSSSHYLRTKGEGENRAHTGGKPDVAVTSFRPSVIFGPDDSFLNRFAALLKLPGPMPLACPDSKFAPVFIDDVCDAMITTLNDRNTFGQSYELCGPDIYSLKELVEFIANQMGKRKIILGMSNGMSKMQASVLQLMPGKPFTMDNYLSLQQDSVCSDKTFNFQALDIKPKSLLASAPAFFKGLRERQRYNHLRAVSED